MREYHSRGSLIGTLVALIAAIVFGIAVAWSVGLQKVYEIPEGSVGIAVWPKWFLGMDGYEVLQPGLHTVSRLKANTKVYLIETGERQVSIEARLVGKIGGAAEKLGVTGKLAGKLIHPLYVKGTITLQLTTNSVAKVARKAKEGRDLSAYIDDQVLTIAMKAINKHRDLLEIQSAFEDQVKTDITSGLRDLDIGAAKVSIDSVTQVSLTTEKSEGKLISKLSSNEPSVKPLPVVNRILWKTCITAFIITAVICFVLIVLCYTCPEFFGAILDIVGSILECLTFFHH